MPRHTRLTPEQIRAEGHRNNQEMLRADIGNLTMLLVQSGSVSVLESDDFQPIIRAWDAAVSSEPPIEV